MKKLSAFSILVFLILISAFGTKAFAMTASFDQKISSQGNVVATFKVLLKDKKVRVESDFGGASNVLISNDSGTYNYVPAQNVATKMPQAMQQMSPAEDLSNFTAFLEKNNAKVVGSETLDGHACDIYQFLDPATQAESKAWVWKEKKFPVKIEISTPAGPTTIDFSNIKIDEKIDDSSFQLPAGAKVTDMAEMMQQQAPPGAAEAPAPEAQG